MVFVGSIYIHFLFLQGAGIPAGFAKTVGIAVDRRRKNKSIESRQRNIQRLKEYKSKLILFPINEKKIRKGESSLEECKLATQLKGEVMPIKKEQPVVEFREVSKDEKKFKAFATLRKVIHLPFYQLHCIEIVVILGSF